MHQTSIHPTRHSFSQALPLKAITRHLISVPHIRVCSSIQLDLKGDHYGNAFLFDRRCTTSLVWIRFTFG